MTAFEDKVWTDDHNCVCDHCREAGSCFGCSSGVCP